MLEQDLHVGDGLHSEVSVCLDIDAERERVLQQKRQSSQDLRQRMLGRRRDAKSTASQGAKPWALACECHDDIECCKKLGGGAVERGA